MSSFWEAKDYNPQLLQSINQGVGAVQEGMAFAREQDRRAKPLHESFQALFDSPDFQQQLAQAQGHPEAYNALLQSTLGQLRSMAGGTGGMAPPAQNGPVGSVSGAAPQGAQGVSLTRPQPVPDLSSISSFMSAAPQPNVSNSPSYGVSQPVSQPVTAHASSAAGQSMPFGGFTPDIPRPQVQRPQPMARRPMTVGDLEDGKAAIPLLQQRMANQGHEERARISGQARIQSEHEKALAKAEIEEARNTLKKYGIDLNALIARERMGVQQDIATGNNQTAVDVANINQSGATKRTNITETGKGERQGKAIEAKKDAAKEKAGSGSGANSYTPEGKAIVAAAQHEVDAAAKELAELRARQGLKEDGKEVMAAKVRLSNAQRAQQEAVQRANRLKAGQDNPAGLDSGDWTTINGVPVRKKK